MVRLGLLPSSGFAIISLLMLVSFEPVISLKCYECSGHAECKPGYGEEKTCTDKELGCFTEKFRDGDTSVGGCTTDSTERTGDCVAEPCVCITNLCNKEAGGGSGSGDVGVRGNGGTKDSNGGTKGNGVGSVGKPIWWTLLLIAPIFYDLINRM